MKKEESVEKKVSKKKKKCKPDYLKAVEVCEKFNISLSTLNRMIEANTFPEPTLIGKAKRWHVDRLRDYNFVKNYEKLSKNQRAGFSDMEFMSALRRLGFAE